MRPRSRTRTAAAALAAALFATLTAAAAQEPPFSSPIELELQTERAVTTVAEGVSFTATVRNAGVRPLLLNGGVIHHSAATRQAWAALSCALHSPEAVPALGYACHGRPFVLPWLATAARCVAHAPSRARRLRHSVVEAASPRRVRADLHLHQPGTRGKRPVAPAGGVDGDLGPGASTYRSRAVIVMLSSVPEPRTNAGR